MVYACASSARETLNKDVREMIDYAESLTSNNSRFFMTVCLNYGSHYDIARAAQKLAIKVQQGELVVADITPALMGENLSTANLPAPDILIRTSGEHRVSNFLLWEISYSELVFVDTYWPDFNKKDLEHVLREFQTRQRRYGH